MSSTNFPSSKNIKNFFLYQITINQRYQMLSSLGYLFKNSTWIQHNYRENM
ncbi:unnamed protein product [Paramecium sonneborni]|uniref:Uncharacterized protein n=1 Tax=Paramecium sonneborni TaxID=65129 RepID=A0A8S1QWA1_9CILI|nr:unnamed protein product [Paramecium sonneborni]